MGRLLAALGIAALGGFGAFRFGAGSARAQQAAVMLQAERARKDALGQALREERLVTGGLRRRVAELEGRLRSADPQRLARLREQLERAQRRVRPSDRLLLMSEGLSLEQLLARGCQEALSELAGAELSLPKGRVGFFVLLTFPPEALSGPESSGADPARLAELAAGLEELPRRVPSHWLQGISLQREGAAPVGVSPHSPLAAELWRVLLEGFLEPHQSLGRVSQHLNYNLHRTCALSITYDLAAEATLELFGAEQLHETYTLGKGKGSRYELIPGGTYVVRARAEGELPWLGVFKTRGKHISELRLSSQK